MDLRTRRREALKLLAAMPLGVAAGGMLPRQAAASGNAAQVRIQSSRGPVEATAGAWRTWVISSGQEYRLGPPPGEDATRAELAELQSMAARRDAETLDRIGYWNAGAPVYRWTERAVKHALTKGMGGPRAQRLLALLTVAIYDASVAAWDTKYAYQRQRPTVAAGSALSPAVTSPASPSYPDEHAVAAGAASAVLGYIFPADAATFEAWADEAARSRAEAGVAYPSDITAGLMLGQRVAERVIAVGQTDGSDAVWTGAVPAEPGTWHGTRPAEPTAGTWKPWALTSASQFRPGPPPAPGSEELARDLAEVRDYPRTNFTNLVASYWEYYGGRAAFDLWNDHVGRKVFEYHLDDNPPRAALVYALAHVAAIDALIACWDAKYTYWAPRPQMLDPEITTVFATPNHPSYPSAHSVWSGAVGSVLGRLFPRDAAFFDGLAEAASEARIMGGIHSRNECTAGLAMGRQVAAAVWERFGPMA